VTSSWSNSINQNWGCAGFQPFSLALGSFNGNGVSLPANQLLRVRVIVNNATPMLLAYGTGTFASSLTLPYASGLG
jgi:hypothetical protein